MPSYSITDKYPERGIDSTQSCLEFALGGARLQYKPVTSKAIRRPPLSTSATGSPESDPPMAHAWSSVITQTHICQLVPPACCWSRASKPSPKGVVVKGNPLSSQVNTSTSGLPLRGCQPQSREPCTAQSLPACLRPLPLLPRLSLPQPHMYKMIAGELTL